MKEDVLDNIKIHFTPKYESDHNGSNYYHKWNEELLSVADGITKQFIPIEYTDSGLIYRSMWEEYMSFSIFAEGKQRALFSAGINENGDIVSTKYYRPKEFNNEQISKAVEYAVKWFLLMMAHGYISITEGENKEALHESK